MSTEEDFATVRLALEDGFSGVPVDALARIEVRLSELDLSRKRWELTANALEVIRDLQIDHTQVTEAENERLREELEHASAFIRCGMYVRDCADLGFPACDYCRAKERARQALEPSPNTWTPTMVSPSVAVCPTCGSDDKARRDKFTLVYPDLYGLDDIEPGTQLPCINSVWHTTSPIEADPEPPPDPPRPPVQRRDLLEGGG